MAKEHKGLSRMIIKKRLIRALPLIIILALILIALAYYKLTIDKGIWKNNEKGRPSEYTGSVKISADTDDAGISIDKDEIIKKALKDLGYKDEDIKKMKDEEIIEILKLSNKLGRTIKSLDDVSSAELMWCLNDLYSEKLTVDELEKLLNAEIITQYPKIKNKTDDDGNKLLDGIIEFERHDTDGNSTKLTYLKKSSFDKMVNDNNTEIVKYFTLDEDGNAVIGIVNSVTEKFSTNDSEVDISQYTTTLNDKNKNKDGGYSKKVYSVSTKTIDYKSAVSQYTMPFEYLWALLTIGKDKDFVLELADLVQDSEITIGLYDNISTTTDETVNTYKKETKKESTTYTVLVNENGMQTGLESTDPQTTTSVSDEYFVNHTYIYEDDEFMYDLTRANVWIIDYKQDYTFKKKEQKSKDVNPSTSADTEFKIIDETSSEPVENEDKSRSTTTTITSMRYVEQKQTNTNINEKQSYVAKSKDKPKIKVDKNDDEPNFVNILCKKKHRDAKTLLTDSSNGGTPDWMFKILRGSEKTSGLVDLTKYLFYKVSNINFGVNDDNFDISMFDVPSFEDAEGNGTSNIDGIQGQIADFFLGKGMSLEGVAALLGNIQQESNFNSSVVSSSGNYIGLCQWGRKYNNTPSRGTELENYANKKGKKWNDADIQINFIWKELNSKGYASVKSKLMSATNASETAEYFARYYEKCVNSDGSLQDVDKRKKYAETWLKELKNRATSGSSSSVNINGSSDQKLKELFPSGVPNSSSQMSKYLKTVKVAITTKSGVKTTKSITVHKSIAKDVQDIFKEAQNSGFKIYDATGYSWREMNNGGSGSRSHHSYGVAIDINVNENYSHKGSKIYAGSFWDPSKSEFSIPKNGVLVKAFKKRGWSWGGNWSGNYQDYMHFSFTGH